MSYPLNKTDGSLLVDLIDGSVDSTSTDITLIGRNYKGFGEFLNENFIKILENFASSSAPTSPLTGQLWYDTATDRLQIYDGLAFKISGGPTVASSFPSSPVAGDLFINNQDDQLFFYDGTSWSLAGPIYTSGQGKSGLEASTLLDTLGRSRVILKMFIQGTLVGIYNNIEFTPASGYEITGITAPIAVGFTPISSTFRFNGTATNAVNLITDSGTRNASSFLPADGDGVTIGTLTIQNTGGLTIGTAQNNVQKISGTSFVVENGLLDHDYKVRVRSSAAGSLIIDALVVDASTKRVGLFVSNPEYTLDVDGDLRITGNLIVEGTTTSFDVTTLRIEDLNIELAVTSDSALLTDAEVDGAGLIIRVTGDDKTWTWDNSNVAWKSSDHINLATGKEYKINGNAVLSETALSPTVTSAVGLTSIGTLTSIDVDNINLNGVTITTTGSGLQIASADTITINNRRITGIATPTSSSDAATKDYVDGIIDAEPVILSLDISGLSNNDIAIVIESLYPAASKANGTYARVSTTSINSSSVSGIDIDAVANKSLIAVDSNGTQNVSVLQDIAFNDASGTVSITVTRGLKRFVVSGGTWTFDTDLSTGL